MSKVVLITGASSGIGKLVGEFLLQKGFTVYGTSRFPDRYPDTKLKLLPLDLKQKQSIQECVTMLLNLEKRIDIVINNAGVGITGAVEEIPEDELKAHFDTNFFGPLQLIQAVLPQMRKQQEGLIINITSIAGYMGLPFRGIYSASKGALSLATEAMRLELKPFNIKISTLAPGDFATNIASRRFHAPLLKNSPYKNAYEKILKMINDDVDFAKNPQPVANAVLKIINKKSPKVHYKVGSFIQRFSVILKGILPNKTYEKLIQKHYKL